MSQPTPPPERRLALIAGIATYKAADIADLPTVEQDLVDLGAVLKSSGYEVTTVLDQTRNELNGRIATFLAHAEAEGATVLLYLSGHGVSADGRDFLIPHDAYSLEQARADPKGTLVDLDLSAAMERSKASTVLQLVDACRETLESPAKALLHPFGTELEKRRHRRLVQVHGCEPNGFCFFDAERLGASLFSEALRRVLDPAHPACTIREVLEAANDELDALVSTYLPNRTQGLHYTVSDSVGEGEIWEREICRGRPNRWRAATAAAALWRRAEPPADDELRSAVEQVAASAWSDVHAVVQDGLVNPWFDVGFPERYLVDLDALLPAGLRLGPREVAAVVAAPFLREIVFARAMSWLAEAQPLDLMPAESGDHARSELEGAHQAFPRLTERARQLPQPERDVLAVWLLNRAVLRQVQFWHSEDVLALSRTLATAIDLPGRAPQTAEWLRGVALHVAAVKEDLDRDADTDRLPLHAKVQTFAHDRGESIRQHALAVLAAIAGQLAIDVRQLGDVLANHLSEREKLSPEAVLAFLGTDVTWSRSQETAALQLVASCPHPALHLALAEQAAHIGDLLDYARRYQRDAAPDVQELLEGLPREVSTEELVPIRDDRNSPAYETPLLTFRLAHDEVRDLLMGVRLYGDPALAIRELYQNALDACRYRRVRAQFSEQPYEGRIAFRQGVEDGRSYIECEDNGVGMGSYELEHVFSRAGRRFVHTPEFLWEQAKWREQRPDLRLWPNSRFGIGVFSYFMLADEIEIWTARADRKSGTAPEQLHVRISSSGSLFRIRREPTEPRRGRGGTLIRLYLRSPEPPAQPVSSLKTLRDLLRYSEFDVTCEEAEDREEWLADTLHVPLSSSTIIRGGDSVWFTRSGGLLTDGILTDVTTRGYFVNLAGKHQATLSVDRGRVEAWDRRWVREAVREAAASVPLGAELDFMWLWTLCAAQPDAGQGVWEALTERDASLNLSSDETASAPVREIGAFGPDRHVAAPPASALMTNGFSELRELGLGDASLITAARWRLLASHWPSLAGRRRGLHAPGTVSWQPTLEPLDCFLLMRDDDDDRRMFTPGEPFSPLEPRHLTLFATRVLRASARFDLGVREVVARFRRLAVFGVIVEADDVDAEDIVADEDDVDIVATLLFPANDLDATVAQLVRLSAHRRVPIRELLDRADRYRRVGLRLPFVPPERIEHMWDRLPLPLEVSASSPNGSTRRWLDVAAAVRTARAEAPVADEALEAVIALAGLDDAHRATLERSLADEQDLIALSRDRDGVAPWIRGRVGAEHIARTAAVLGESGERVCERLRAYADILELTLPSTLADDLEPTVDINDAFHQMELPERLLLSVDLDGELPVHLDELPLAHLLGVCSKLGESVGRTVERLEGLPERFRLAAPELSVPVLAWTPSSSHRAFFACLPIREHEVVPTPLRFVMTALLLSESVGGAYRAVADLHDLLPGMPALDGRAEALDDLRPEREDEELLLDAGTYRSLLGEVTPRQILQGAIRLGWPLGRVYDRMLAYAPLGLTLPAVDDGPWRATMPSWEDVIVLAAGLDGGAFLPPGRVGGDHVRRAASALRGDPDHVRDRLERYAGLCGFELESD